MDDKLKQVSEPIQYALVSLGVLPTDKSQIELGLVNLLNRFPKLSIQRVEDVALNASTGKYGIPHKYTPALIGSWFHKFNTDRENSLKGRL